MQPLLPSEVFGLIHPSIDAHTLGISRLAGLLREANYGVAIGGRDISLAIGDLRAPSNVATLVAWIEQHRISRLGMSCRLDPRLAVELLDQLRFTLRSVDTYGPGVGQIRKLYFAGLPAACHVVSANFGDEIPVFSGDESDAETLSRMGLPPEQIPVSLISRSRYDAARLEFGHGVVNDGSYALEAPPPRPSYARYGSSSDTLVERLMHNQGKNLGPLLRTHYGEYHPDRKVALTKFLAGVRSIADAGHIDVLSIGTSQLTQERFGEAWDDERNGGGVPINSRSDYEQAAAAAAPMLVRTYAGTARVPELARIHQETLNIAWHALSLWWFCRLDGRGPNTVTKNLREHIETLDYIASTGKPFEPNIPHHFSFRGGDDLTYVVSAVLAARLARRRGVRHLVLQTMLNTPKATAGVQDLAKARAALKLTREIPGLAVILQPRAGLDYLTADAQMAKAQLASVTALMDDIEPGVSASPGVIHVVNYTEGSSLATPPVVAESAQITRASLRAYRRKRIRGEVPDMSADPEVIERTDRLVHESRTMLAAIEAAIPDPYSVEGLRSVLAAGFLAAPNIWEEREEFIAAVRWRTGFRNGGVVVLNSSGHEMRLDERIQQCISNAHDNRSAHDLAK